jgi:ATP-binding cassette subfamily F protein 3
MLDEPTNHLDMHSCDLLIDALKKYAGSIILVSHDRYFISKTANKIWEIVDHQIKEFKGGYEEWVEWKERMSANKKAQSAAEKEPAPLKAAPAETTNVVKKAPEPDREAKKELQRLQKKFAQLEEEISKVSKKKAELEQALSNPATYSNPLSFAGTEKSYKQVTADLERLNKDYEALFEKLMSEGS